MSVDWTLLSRYVASVSVVVRETERYVGYGTGTYGTPEGHFVFLVRDRMLISQERFSIITPPRSFLHVNPLFWFPTKKTLGSGNRDKNAGLAK